MAKVKANLHKKSEHNSHFMGLMLSLQWRHNDRDGASNYQPHDCLLNRLFRRRSKKAYKLRVTGLSTGYSPVTGEFPAQKASNSEKVSIWWRHRDAAEEELLSQHPGISIVESHHTRWWRARKYKSWRLKGQFKAFPVYYFNVIIFTLQLRNILIFNSITKTDHPQPQTPPFQHCPQIRFGRESDQNLKCTETATKMRNLFCNDLEYIGLFKVIIYVLLSVIYSKIIMCFCNKVVQRMYTADVHSFVFGIL